MYILVFSAYKTASRAARTTLSKHLRDPQHHTIAHLHNRPLDDSPHDVLVTTVRPHAQIFKSAYFQDISESSGYPYSRCLGMPGGIVVNGKRPTTEVRAKIDRVLNVPIEEIVSHFMSFRWEAFSWLSLNVTLQHINAAHDPPLIPTLDSEGVQIHRTVHRKTGRPVTSILMHYMTLMNPALIQKTFSSIGLELRLDRPQRVNVGARKWYGDVYQKFLEVLPKEFDERYRYVDQPFVSPVFDPTDMPQHLYPVKEHPLSRFVIHLAHRLLTR